MVCHLLLNGLALSIHYDRKSLYDIEGRGRHVEFADTIKQMKDYIANYDAMLAVSNKANPAIYRFRAKNMYGMHDVQEIVATTDYSTDPTDTKEILESLPDIEDENYVDITSD